VPAELTVIWWRDIPAQVVARTGRRTSVKVELEERFQEAIDAAAMRAGLIGTDAYLAEWRRETRPCGDDLDAEAHDEAARLDAAYPDDELDRLAIAGGLR
jgi:Virulence factor